MENYNIDLLNETYNRIVNVLEKNSNLKIFIGGNINDINSDFTEICISRERSSSLMFKSIISRPTEEANKYSFLLYHKNADYYNYICSSIFKFAEKCRHYQSKCCIDDYSISYELYSSEAGKIIKELGFPTCLEELAMKMDLMGI
jgi:hypothetical protein